MFKKKYLLVLLALAPVFLLLAPETASAQAVPQSHESCTQGVRFHYSRSADELDWGIQVNCSSGSMIRIHMDAWLSYEQPDHSWLQVSSLHKTCFSTNQCTDTEILRIPPWGDYHIVFCYEAESTGSEWAYICNGVYKSLP